MSYLPEFSYIICLIASFYTLYKISLLSKIHIKDFEIIGAIKHFQSTSILKIALCTGLSSLSFAMFYFFGFESAFCVLVCILLWAYIANLHNDVLYIDRQVKKFLKSN